MLNAILKYLFVIFLIGAVNCVYDDRPDPPSINLSYSDLLDKLTDLKSLAVLPEPGETGAMWSSYDRSSKYDMIGRTYKEWHSNHDSKGYIRKQFGNYVIAEMNGPGCIWRIWSASPHKGAVKIFIDDPLVPSIDLPFWHYFSSSLEPFQFPSLVYPNAAFGKNNYIPIPFNTYCRIEAEPGYGRYYHINYSSFPEGTTVPAFPVDLSPQDLQALQETNDFFADDSFKDAYEKGLKDIMIHDEIQIDPGKTGALADIAGEYAIKSIKIKNNFNDISRSDQIRALRKMSLQIMWDGESEPSVWCPLGDFFGTAPGANRFETLPVGVTEDEMYCNWYMPFDTGARIEITNEDSLSHLLEFEIIYAPIEHPVENLGRFHAKWHRDVLPLSDGSRWLDWTVLKTEGTGRFVGMMLNVWNPRGGWWGEGDEKFFVDGEKFPSTFGTGTEDYFGYAYGNARFFEKPFHSQSYASEMNRGHITLCRWHISDNIPFQKSFEGYLGKYQENDWPTQYACVVYWYLSSNGIDPLGPVPVEERYGYEIPYQ